MMLAIVTASIAVSFPAFAQSHSWHATFGGDVAVTDNVYSAPTGSPSRDGDLFFQLRPGFIFSRNAPRMIHELAADAQIVHYAFNSRVPSVSGSVGWRAFFLPGPRSQVLTEVNAGTGILTALSSRLTANETMINVAPASQVTFKQASANQVLSYVATRELRLTQSLFARWSENDDNAEDLEPPMGATITKSAEAGFSLGMSRAFRNDSLSVEAGGSVQRFERDAPATALMGPRLNRQYAPRARATWSHDINRRLSFAVDGGLVLHFPFGTDPDNPDEDREDAVFPVMGAQFAVSEVWGRGVMSLRRDVSPNQFLAQNTINTGASVAAAVPLPWLEDTRRRAPNLVGLGSFAIQRTQLIDIESGDAGGIRNSIGSARIDAAVVYTPKPGFSYGVRYELVYQTGDPRAEMAIEGFWRNAIYFTFALRYPDQLAGIVPKRTTGSGSRTDNNDLGSEPVVPELLEEGEALDER